MKVHQLIIALIVVSVFIIGGVNMLISINTEYEPYGVNVSTDRFDTILSNASQGINDEYATGETMKSTTIGGNQSITEGNTLDNIILGSYQAVRRTTNSLSVIQKIFAAVADELGVPDYFLKALSTIIIVTLVFASVYLFMRVGKGT